MAKVVDIAYQTLIAGLGLATIYIAGTFSINMYRGLSWHNAQKKLEAEGGAGSAEQPDD